MANANDNEYDELVKYMLSFMYNKQVPKTTLIQVHSLVLLYKIIAVPGISKLLITMLRKNLESDSKMKNSQCTHRRQNLFIFLAKSFLPCNFCCFCLYLYTLYLILLHMYMPI